MTPILNPTNAEEARHAAQRNELLPPARNGPQPRHIVGELLRFPGRIPDAGGRRQRRRRGVAAGIAINVTQPHFTSFAGVAPILVYMAETDEVVSISGLGGWPKAATAEYFIDKYGDLPLGMERCVVPSACDAWLTALERFGTMTFEQVVGPSVRLADEGFPAAPRLSAAAHRPGVLDRWPYDAQIFAPNGAPIKTTQPFVQKDLANVFKQMIEVERANVGGGREGGIRAARDFFYKGEIAEKMVAFSEAEGGLMTMQDFADFSVAVEKPEMGTYGDYSIYTCGPWCQGPSLISVLNLMEGFDLQSMGHNSPDYLHALLESIKLAFSDRHYFYGDPDFVDVPMEGLLSKGYADARRAAIDMARAYPEMPPMGDPWPYQGAASRNPAMAAPAAQARPHGARHQLRLRRRQVGQRLLRHAQRQLRLDAVGARPRHDCLLPRHPDLAGRRPPIPAGTRQASPDSRPTLRWPSRTASCSCPSAPPAATCRCRGWRRCS